MKAKVIVALVLQLALVDAAFPFDLMLPEMGKEVPLLSEGQKAFFDSPDAERLEKAGDVMYRARLLALGWYPRPTVFVWSGINTRKERVNFRIVREEDEVAVCDTNLVYLTTGRFEWDNFRVGCAYRWEIQVAGKGAKTGRFRTEAHPPRLIRVPGVPNFRDLGGWKTRDGREVRQGLIYRSANLCENATECPELRKRFDDEGAHYMTNGLGIRTELDLRSAKECGGIVCSPLGETVHRYEIESGCYAQMKSPWAMSACRRALEIITNAKALPILIHCSSGQDRTGSLAFIINGLLGVSEEDLVRDWEASALWKEEHDWFNRNNSYAALLEVMASYPGETINERIEAYVKAAGFTEAQIVKLRTLLLK